MLSKSGNQDIVGFNPEQLGSNASLNRVCIVDLPGLALDADIRGKRAFELFSSELIVAEIAAHAQLLGLDPADKGNLFRQFDACFSSPDIAVREGARSIVQQFGQRLGYILLTLKRGDQVNRQARPEWDGTYWDYWSSISSIWLGGGLAAGHLGNVLCQAASEVFREAGIDTCAIRLADHPAILPLIGAARSAPRSCRSALVFDFGQSYCKRGFAIYTGDSLVRLELLAPRPSPRSGPNMPLPAQAAALAEAMIGIMLEAWHEARWEANTETPAIIASIASYMVNGQPAQHAGGGYAPLALLAANTADWFAGRIGEYMQRPVTVELLHDGTAAARKYAGRNREAVIMLGTSLGVGYTVANELLWQLPLDFEVFELIEG